MSPAAGGVPALLGRLAARRPIWTDQLAVSLLAAAVALNALLGLLLWRRLEALPELVALHFNAYGEADIIGPRTDLYKLPVIGTVVWATNGVLAVVTAPHDRVLARLILSVALFVQLLLCLAAWRMAR